MVTCDKCGKNKDVQDFSKGERYICNDCVQIVSPENTRVIRESGRAEGKNFKSRELREAINNNESVKADMIREDMDRRRRFE